MDNQVSRRAFLKATTATVAAVGTVGAHATAEAATKTKPNLGATTLPYPSTSVGKSRGMQVLTPIRGIHVGSHFSASRRTEAGIDRTLFIRNDHDVAALAVAAGDDVCHSRRKCYGHRRKLLCKIESQCVLVGSPSTFAVGIPFVDVVAATDDTEVTRHVGLLCIDRWQCDTVFHIGHDVFPIRVRWTGGRRSGR